MKSKKAIGTICGIAAAICYGMNPLGAMKLYGLGYNTNTVLFFRFGVAWLIMTVIMLVRRESFRVTRREFGVVTGLGILFAISSLALYLSFHHMATGVASTILFIYPVLTVIIMAVFFHEHVSKTTIFSILLALSGVLLLYWGDSTGPLSFIGVFLVFMSALSYALYIILVDRSHIQLSAFQINFYVLFYCALSNLLCSWIMHDPIQMVHGTTAIFYVIWQSIIPTIGALVLMVYAAKYVGSTTTAILGALEPLTAVLIGIIVFHEPFGLRLATGIGLILGAVVLIVLRKSTPEEAVSKKPIPHKSALQKSAHDK